MSNSYLIGAMLDPLVVEFMSPEYCEAMLEAKIRTDEIRGNCPPRAGYVCVLDPRVKTGRYYRKQVAGEGVNALPPSRIEKALAQQEQRSQKGEGISFLGKAAIAGGLAVGGLAAIGAIANSGRSTEPVPDIPNGKAKPDTSVKSKTSTYEEARGQALLSGKKRLVKPPVEAIDNGVIIATPRSPQEARRKRGQGEVATVVQKVETVKQPSEVAVRSPEPEIVSPQPEVTATPKAKKKSEPLIDTTTAQGLSHTTIRDGYAAIADVAGKQNIGYKSAAQLRQKLGENGVIRSGRMADNKADFEALLDNGMLVEKGYLVQTKTGYGGYGKDNVGMVRVPAFMSPKDFSNATSNILAEGKGGAGITDRIERSESLVAAINEKLNKAEDLTDTEREQLTRNRESLNLKIGIDKAKIQKGSEIAETNKPTGIPKKAKPETPKAVASPKVETPVIAQQPIEDPTTIMLEKPVASTLVRPQPAKPQVKRQKGLGWIDAKNDEQFYDKVNNLIETDERVAKFKARANADEQDAVAKRIKKMHDEIDLSDPLNKAFAEDLKNAHYKIFGKTISSKKQNNDAIASHETYHSARGKAKRDALRRFAA